MTLQERALTLMDAATDLVDHIDRKDWQAALVGFNQLADLASGIAPELAQEALNEGMTKKYIAERLDISPRMLTGMEKTR